MSHVATVDVEINDLEALGEAAKVLGLDLMRGQKSYRWYGHHVGDYPVPAGFDVADLGKCEHALRVKGDGRAYEVGVVKRRDGKPGYSLMWDFWSGGYGLEAKVGKDCSKLRQEYAAAVARRQAVQLGYKVTRETTKAGQIKLHLSR